MSMYTTTVDFVYRDMQFKVKATYYPRSYTFSYWDEPEESYVETWECLEPSLSDDEEIVLNDDELFQFVLHNAVEKKYFKAQRQFELKVHMKFMCNNLFNIEE